MTAIHIHQHRLDQSHNMFLLLIPGLIFMVVIGVYLILKIQVDTTSQSESEAQSIIDKTTPSY